MRTRGELPDYGLADEAVYAIVISAAAAMTGADYDSILSTQKREIQVGAKYSKKEIINEQ